MHVLRICFLCLVALSIGSQANAQSKFLNKLFSKNNILNIKNHPETQQSKDSKSPLLDNVSTNKQVVLKAEFYLSPTMLFSNINLKESDQKIQLNFLDFDSAVYQASIHNINGDVIKPIESPQVLLEELDEGTYLIVLENKGSYSRITTKYINVN